MRCVRRGARAARSCIPARTRSARTQALNSWVRASGHHEVDGDCADYFLVPTHPEGGSVKPTTGDRATAALFSHLRVRWPYWNRSAAAGEARHFWLLPCDHGPGDCAYSRPIRPLKYTSEALQRRDLPRTFREPSTNLPRTFHEPSTNLHV